MNIAAGWNSEADIVALLVGAPQAHRLTQLEPTGTYATGAAALQPPTLVWKAPRRRSVAVTRQWT
jgi:hypothetical protein